MRERAKELRTILLDRPMPPMETGIWWVEYVLRHKDTSHLRPAGFDQYWFQRRLLDVWLFLYVLALLAVLFPILVCMWACKKCLSSKKVGDEAKLKLN